VGLVYLRKDTVKDVSVQPSYKAQIYVLGLSWQTDASLTGPVFWTMACPVSHPAMAVSSFGRRGDLTAFTCVAQVHFHC